MTRLTTPLTTSPKGARAVARERDGLPVSINEAGPLGVAEGADRPEAE